MEVFKNDHDTLEFKEKNEKAKQSQTHNEHPHFRGSVGYTEMRPEWLVTDLLSSSSSCGSISSTLLIEDHSLNWVQPRTKKMADWNYYIFNRKTIRREKHEEVSQGMFFPK